MSEVTAKFEDMVLHTLHHKRDEILRMRREVYNKVFREEFEKRFKPAGLGFWVRKDQ